MQERNVFGFISRGTEYDLSDAKLMADKVFLKSGIELDSGTTEFSKELFIAVAMEITYSDKIELFDEMLDYLVDPAWDCALQMLFSFQRSNAFEQKEANVWLNEFTDRCASISMEKAELLVKSCYLQWTSAFATAKVVKKESMPPQSSVQIFNPLVRGSSPRRPTNKKDKGLWNYSTSLCLFYLCLSEQIKTICLQRA